MIFRFVLAMIIPILLTVGFDPAGAQGSVEGNILTWTGFPAVTLKFTDSFSYIGSQKYTLYGSTQVDLYLFGELEGRRIKRLYWVQFERYLPFNRYTYDYSDSQRMTEVGGVKYYDDTWYWNLETRKRKPGSDTEHVLALIEKQGYSIGPENMGLRLVRLDSTRRKELMFIFLEDLRDHGLTTKDLSDGGKSAHEWDLMTQGLRRRALTGLQILEK